MRNIIIFLIVLLLLTGGYFILLKESSENISPDQSTDEVESQSVKGLVTDINLEQMALDGPALITVATEADGSKIIAIPSMGISLCAASENMATVSDIEIGDEIFAQGALDENEHLVPCEKPDHFLEVKKLYTNEQSGYQFSYKKAPNGYILVAEENESEAISNINLFNQKEYEEFINSTDPREGPVSISIRVFENTDKLSPAVWSMQNPSLSNETLATNDPAEATIGGVNAVTFIADGLWPIHTYVAAHDSKIYLISAMIPDEVSAIKSDFDHLLESFTFIQTN